MRVELTDFKYGLITKIEEQSIFPTASSGMLGFHTKGDHIELRRGSKVIGTVVNDDTTPVQGLHVAKKSNGDEICYKKVGRKLYYALDPDSDFIEVGTDLFPEAAVDDECTFVDYETLAGSQMFFSSPNSSLYKIMLANPGDYVDFLETEFRGYIFASQNRIFLVNRTGSDGSFDKTGVYLSFIDSATYTDVTAENVGTGNGSNVTFTETLNFKAGGAKRTCFGVSITDGVETFVDDFNGNLIGNLGGTGTINYTTGAISVTFNIAPVNLQAITADYQWEDSSNGGVADFSYSSPRESGEGDVFRQDDGGGPAQAVDTYQDIEYCFHTAKTWALQLSIDDTDAENLPYRKQVGIPTWKARCATGEGIYYVDVTNKNDPKIRLLTLESASDRVVPKSISDKVDLSGYRFDDAWVERFGNLIVVGCRTEDSVKNNRVIVYDTDWKSIDVLDYFGSMGKVWNGTLIIGDSLSPNVYTAFSGYDDSDAIVQGFYETSEWDLDEENKLKKVKKLQIEGLIQTNQIIGVYAKPDKGPYVFLGYIRGDGDYVDRTQAVSIGSLTVGRGVVGAGGGETAFHYFRELKFAIGKFMREKIKFQVETFVNEDGMSEEGIGFFSVSTIAFDSVRIKQEKLPRKYRIKRGGQTE